VTRPLSHDRGREPWEVQPENSPFLAAVTNDDQPAGGKISAGPCGALESRTGMPDGWPSKTSTQLPPSGPLYEDLRQPWRAELSGMVWSVTIFVVLCRCPQEGERFP